MCQAVELVELSSTTARQLDSSTDLDSYSTPRHMESASTGSTGTRQELDRNSTGSTGKVQARPRQRLDSASTEGTSEPDRQLDSSTARAQCRSLVADVP